MHPRRFQKLCGPRLRKQGVYNGPGCLSAQRRSFMPTCPFQGRSAPDCANSPVAAPSTEDGTTPHTFRLTLSPCSLFSLQGSLLSLSRSLTQCRLFAEAFPAPLQSTTFPTPLTLHPWTRWEFSSHFSLQHPFPCLLPDISPRVSAPTGQRLGLSYHCSPATGIMPGYMSINTQESWTIKNKRKTAGTCHGTQQWQNKGGKKGNHVVRSQAIIPQEHSEITEEPNRAIDMIEKVGQETPSQVHPTGLPASTAAPSLFSTRQPNWAFKVKSCHVPNPTTLLATHRAHQPLSFLRSLCLRCFSPRYALSPLLQICSIIAQ